MDHNSTPSPIKTSDDVAEWLIDGGLPAVMAVQLADSTDKFTFNVKGDANVWFVFMLERMTDGSWHESARTDPRPIGDGRPAFIAG